MLLEIVKSTFNLRPGMQQCKLPICQYLLLLFGMWWRQHKATMLSPHLALHNAGGVTAVTNGDHRLVVDQVWYLLSIVFVGWREVNGCQLATCIASRMQLETVMPTL